jgi:serine protease Do
VAVAWAALPGTGNEVRVNLFFSLDFGTFTPAARGLRVKPGANLKSFGGVEMLKRFYLLLSLVAVISMAVAATTTAAGQKEKQKDKAEKDKKLNNSEDGSRQFFLLPQLGGEGSYLGVYLEEVTPDRIKELGLTEERGAIIMKVVQGSPAEKAGLKENDVVVAFNGQRVDSMMALRRVLSETPADRNVQIEVIRGGNRQTVTATLSKKSQGFGLASPEWNAQLLHGEEARKRAEELLRQNQDGTKGVPDFGNFSFVNPGEFTIFRGGRLGISAESLTDQLAEYFGVKEGRGVLVSQVNEDSPADKAGLKAGDVIVAIDNEKVDNLDTLVNALSKKEEGSVSMKVIRNRAEQIINVTLEKRTQLSPGRPRAGLTSAARATA